jgi:hypothetical protein
VLKDDKRAIFQAASHAQRAADYLHSMQPALEPPAPVLSDPPGEPFGLSELPPAVTVAEEPPASPLALVVDRPEKRNAPL